MDLIPPQVKVVAYKRYSNLHDPCALQTSANGARDQTCRFVISLEIFFAGRCCCSRNFSKRNHRVTHPRVTAAGWGGLGCRALPRGAVRCE